MSKSSYIDMLDKPFIYTVGLVIYANSLSGCSMHISSIELPDLDKNHKNTLCRLQAFGFCRRSRRVLMRASSLVSTP